MFSLMKPEIVVSLPVTRPDDLNKVNKIDGLVELRLDYSTELPNPEELIPFKHKVLVTLRDKEEGGRIKYDVDFKAKYLERLNELGILYDVEASFLERRKIEYVGKIVSAHYFSSLPSTEEIDRLFRKYEEAYTIKVAVASLPGYRELLSYVSGKPNATFMPMSNDPIERLAFSLLGSKLLYTYLESPTAQGQLSYTQAKQILECIFK